MLLRKLVSTLAVTFFVAAPATALAQPARWLPTPVTAAAGYSEYSPVSYAQARQEAYERGYREGFRRGERDARRGDRFGYHEERDFQRADKGYHRGLGDRDRYRQIFRDGYASGYAEAYARFDRYGRYGRTTSRPGSYGHPGPYGQRGGYGSWGGGLGPSSPAFENGAREGYEKGREDARKNRSFDPRRHGWYRDGDRHYEREYGPREVYKDVYRRGFQEGYERGFREARYRW